MQISSYDGDLEKRCPHERLTIPRSHLVQILHVYAGGELQQSYLRREACTCLDHAHQVVCSRESGWRNTVTHQPKLAGSGYCSVYIMVASGYTYKTVRDLTCKCSAFLLPSTESRVGTCSITSQELFSVKSSGEFALHNATRCITLTVRTTAMDIEFILELIQGPPATQTSIYIPICCNMCEQQEHREQGPAMTTILRTTTTQMAEGCRRAQRRRAGNIAAFPLVLLLQAWHSGFNSVHALTAMKPVTAVRTTPQRFTRTSAMSLRDDLPIEMSGWHVLKGQGARAVSAAI